MNSVTLNNDDIRPWQERGAKSRLQLAAAIIVFDPRRKCACSAVVAKDAEDGVEG